MSLEVVGLGVSVGFSKPGRRFWGLRDFESKVSICNQCWLMFL